MNQINILVPELPESISNATVITWHKKIGDIIQQDEILVDIETEKVILEVPAVTNGILLSILKSEGEIVNNKEVLGYIKESKDKNIYNIIKKKNKNPQICNEDIILKKIKNQITHFSPSIRKLISKKNINISKILKINKKDLIQKENILDIKKNNKNKNITLNSRLTKTIKMTSMRKRIGERLLKTKNNTAMLTTFNEVNMQSIINMRNIYSKLFQDQHNIKLGFMSFFVKAVVESLKKYPDINSMIKEDNIIYYKYFDINIAVSTEKGLVTPVLRDVNLMNMAEIEKKIAYFSCQAKQEKLELSDLIGGNFTITNGGIFGSLMSTPIINPPQVAILGMHTIKDRPIVINKEIKILPMMYLALSYDHRMIDGKQAVGFLNMIKNILEDFSRILLDI